MVLVPWDVHLKAGQLGINAATLATALLASLRRHPRPGPRPGPPAPEPVAPPPPPPRVRAHVVPPHPAPADATHTAAVTDLCTCVAELASDLAKRYGGEI
ncbi:hypothetical protein [Streptomyces sp. NPDC046939]|uniref:hypothetical protein n=1 Tax=Streptomyces sp. NPDC046939 TaxID=3155376 RepID=UPI0033EB1C6C